MRKMLANFLAYINNIGKENTDESSKRALALYCVIILATYVVVRFTDKNNMEIVLAQLLSAAFGFLGITAFEKHSTNKHKNKKDENN